MLIKYSQRKVPTIVKEVQQAAQHGGRSVLQGCSIGMLEYPHRKLHARLPQPLRFRKVHACKHRLRALKL